MTDVAAIQSEFDRLAQVEALRAFSHTEFYSSWILRRLPRRVSRMAEVGCGVGALTALLAPLTESLLAIDLSPEMLRLARARCAGVPHVAFEHRDANEWDPGSRSLDVIVSAATLHHLEAEVVLPRWAAALRPGGVLLVLDVLDRPGVTSAPVNGLAILSSGWLRWRRTGRLLADPRVRAAWEAHARFDRLPTIGEARRMARALLPAARVRHHLLWRYSIEYHAPDICAN